MSSDEELGLPESQPEPQPEITQDSDAGESLPAEESVSAEDLREAREREDGEREDREREDGEADLGPGRETPPPAKLERLQKIMAQAGVASRRHAEELIAGGHVQVNGQIVTALGSKADAARDHIRVDGKLLRGAERLRYFILNKPKGFVTTASDPEGRPTVMQFFSKMHERLYPVGRLDYLSEGLLLVTNDGELAHKLTRAASGVEKTYLVKISGQPTEAELDILRGGVAIDRGKPDAGKVRTAPARIREVRQGDNPWFEVVLIEGRNRELRKMFQEIGHFVEKIRRVGYGPLILDLEPGKIRELDQEELTNLRKAAEGKWRAPRTKEARARAAAHAEQLPTVAPRPTPQRPAKPFPAASSSGKPFSKPFSGPTQKPFTKPARPGQQRFGAGRSSAGRAGEFRPKRPFSTDRPARDNAASGRPFPAKFPAEPTGRGPGSAGRPFRPAERRSAEGRRAEGRAGEGGLSRPFTTSSGKPRPGGARPSSKPGKSAGHTYGAGQKFRSGSGPRPAGGPGAGSSRSFASPPRGSAESRPSASPRSAGSFSRPPAGRGTARPGSGHAGPERFGPERFGPERFGPERFGPAKFGPGRSGPGRSGSGRSGSGKFDPARSGSGKPGSGRKPKPGFGGRPKQDFSGHSRSSPASPGPARSGTGSRPESRSGSRSGPPSKGGPRGSGGKKFGPRPGGMPPGPPRRKRD